MPVLNIQALIDNRVNAIKEYHKNAGMQRAELDVSGGVDSAVMLLLLARALGPENITAVYSQINSSSESGRRARAIADVAGVSLVRVAATGTYNVLEAEALYALTAATGVSYEVLEERMKSDPTIAGSLRACLRATLGRFLNRLTGNGIRHGTGNEDEDRWLRFYQKGGDGDVDTNPLAMLSKGEVYQLAVGLGVPEEIITCMPTPDLWGNGEEHNDEEELSKLSGVEWTYSRVDPKTGKYVKVGTIERMSRLLDEPFAEEATVTMEDGLFRNILTTLIENSVSPLLKKYRLTADHLASARKWECMTRHKMNPNCPSLGSRQELLDAGILTNEFPEVKLAATIKQTRSSTALFGKTGI